MGEPAKPFWINEDEALEVAPAADYEDISCLSTGETDDNWKFGSD